MEKSTDSKGSEESEEQHLFSHEDIDTIAALCRDFLENDNDEGENDDKYCLSVGTDSNKKSSNKRKDNSQFPIGILKRNRKIGEATEESTSDERVKEIMSNLKRCYQDAFNANDRYLFRTLISEYCTDNIVMKLLNLPAIEGKAAIEQYFRVYDTSPDHIIRLSEPTRAYRVITSKVTSDGTYMDLSSPQFDQINVFRQAHNPLISPETYARVAALEAAGKPITIRSETFAHFILNEEMTHIEKIALSFRSLDAFEAVPVPR